MKGIEFDVLWWDDNQTQLNDLGVRPDIKDADRRKVTFYTIDSISPYFEGDYEYTTIMCSGVEYILPHAYNFVKTGLELGTF